MMYEGQASREENRAGEPETEIVFLINIGPAFRGGVGGMLESVSQFRRGPPHSCLPFKSCGCGGRVACHLRFPTLLLCSASAILTNKRMPRRSSTPPEYMVTFSLRSACVIPYDDRSSRFRSAIVSLRDDVEAVVHGFSEYVNGYQRITAVRPPSDGDKALLGGSPPTRCLNRPLGIAVPFSCNNIYHQAFHAVPAFERWAAIASAAGSAVDFVPLIYPTAAVGKKMSIEPRKWHAWEWSIRPFTRESSATIANRTHQLVNAPCVCYDVLHGNADAFNPIAVRSAGRLRAFRSAALVNLHAAAYPFPASVRAADSLDGSTARAQMLLWVVRRHKLRNIDNEAALAKRLEGDPVLSQRVHRLVLDELPLGTQMRLVISAWCTRARGSPSPSACKCSPRRPHSPQVHACSGLIAVHGQAMAWVMFLASDAHRTAAVEIFPQGLVNTIYEMASQALGVRYESLRAPASPGCGGGARESRLNCNVTVDVGTVLEVVRRAAEYTRTGTGDAG